MNPDHSTEIIGKAVVVAAIAMIASTSAPIVVVASCAASLFCVGRWLSKLRR